MEPILINETTDDIPPDVVYATRTNLDRAAINEAIFAEHLRQTHSKNPNVSPPMHTICIMASEPKWKKSQGGPKEYIPFNGNGMDVLYGNCGEGHVKGVGSDNHYYDPMLKLYHGRPVMINKNKDVKNCIANGAMGKFTGVVLKRGITTDDLDIVKIDDYFVRAASVSQIASVRIEMTDGDQREVSLSSEKITAKCSFPMALFGPVDGDSFRVARKISFSQFPINVANARTVHKLQGRTIVHLLVSSWSYIGNWIYVVLSRCTRLAGLYLRSPIDSAKVVGKGMSEECRDFLRYFREHKQPAPRVSLPRE